MIKKFAPINKKFPHIWHGGDYNPDQWIDYPEILEDDIQLMKMAKFNTPTIGVFSWSQIEVEEGKFNFDWLDRVMDNLAENGIKIIMATPTASPPRWMCKKYPEILRQDPGTHRRNDFKWRVNYCPSSPLYREKCRIIDAKLAERYKGYPIVLWHINNEMAWACFCPVCQENFRTFLRNKYKDIKILNDAYWSYFWSHRYNSFEEIEVPPTGYMAQNNPHQLDRSMPSLLLDFYRFTSKMLYECYKNEADVLRSITKDVPVTTNMWGYFGDLSYYDFQEDVDVVAVNNYPNWTSTEKDVEEALKTAFKFNLYRAAKNGKPFVMMESTPGVGKRGRLKRPNLAEVAALQSVAHGADAVCYYVWRAARGGYELFCDAVVGHANKEDTLSFKTVSNVGDMLSKLDEIVGTSVDPEVAIVYDNEISYFHFALGNINGYPTHYNGFWEGGEYASRCQEHYAYFWEAGIPVDVIDLTKDLSKYKLVILPSTFMVTENFAERVEKYVKNGGTIVMTYDSGIVEESGRVVQGGYPGYLRDVVGLWVDEQDIGLPGMETKLIPEKGYEYLEGSTAKKQRDLIHVTSAEVILRYGEEFYKGIPAMTVNKYGKGKAYYIGSDNGKTFLKIFYNRLSQDLSIKRILDCDLPQGINVQLRTDGENNYIFLMNFMPKFQTIELPRDKTYIDILNNKEVKGKLEFPMYGYYILKTSV